MDEKPSFNFRVVTPKEYSVVSTEVMPVGVPALTTKLEIRNYTKRDVTLQLRDGSVTVLHPEPSSSTVDNGCVVFHSQYTFNRDKTKSIFGNIGAQSNVYQSNEHAQAVRDSIISSKDEPGSFRSVGSRMAVSDYTVSRINESAFNDKGSLYIAEMDLMMCIIPPESIPTHPLSTESSLETVLDRIYDLDRDVPVSYSMFLVDSDNRFPPLFAWTHDQVTRVPVIRKHHSFSDGLWILKVQGTDDRHRSSKHYGPDEILKSKIVFRSEVECEQHCDPIKQYARKQKQHEAELERVAYLRRAKEEEVKIATLDKQHGVIDHQIEAMGRKVVIEERKNQLDINSMQRKDHYDSVSSSRRDSTESLKAMVAAVPLMTALGVGAYKLWQAFS